MSAKPFYNHIAGLRGIAIILVILFHLNIALFPHGYYGVDIFLVISGYLLFLSYTRQGNHLDLKEFATKKLLRIFPPMIILVLAVLLVSLLLHDWEDIMNAARNSRHTLFCTINGFLRKTQENYFAADAVENPFLHMWYLAVTVHLYLLFAAGCFLNRFIPRKLSLIIVWIIGISSFIYSYSYQLQGILQSLSIPGWGQDFPISHYNTFPRIWEILAGGLILTLPNAQGKVKSNILTIIGLFAAIAPALAPHSWADYGVPAVVIGTMLIIRYMPESSLMPILSNAPLLWIGGISFSLYLVHMPIIAFYRTWYMTLSSVSSYAIIVVLSLILAYLFWHLVEKRHFKLSTTLIMWALAMGFSVLGKSTQGYKDYLRADINKIQITPFNDWKVCGPNVLANGMDTKNLVFSKGIFTIGATTAALPTMETPLMPMGPESETPSIVLIGDSHAQSAYFGLNHVCKELNIPGAYMGAIITPFWDKELPGGSNYCFNQARAEALLAWLKANPSITHVVIAQHWRLRLERKNAFVHWDKTREALTFDLLYQSLRTFVQKVNELDKHVILLGPCPELPINSPTRHIRLCTRRGEQPFDLAPITSTLEYSNEINKEPLALVSGIQQEGLCSVLDGMSILKPDTPFCAYQNGVFLMKDDDHFTHEGSIMLFSHLKPQLEAFLKQKKPQNHK